MENNNNYNNTSGGGYVAQVPASIPQPVQADTPAGTWQPAAGMPETPQPVQSDRGDPGKEIPATALDYLGWEFQGTKAAEFNTLEELGDAYNQLEAKMQALEDSIPLTPEEYNIEMKYPEAADSVRQAAFTMHLDPKQAECLAGLAESIIDMPRQQLQQQGLDFLEQTKKTFGQNTHAAMQKAEYVIENIVPQVTGMKDEEFVDMLNAYGVLWHPAVISLLNHIADLYAQGRGNITPNVVPAGSFGAVGGRSIEFFNTPEAKAILANPAHPQHKQYATDLMALYGR